MGTPDSHGPDNIEKVDFTRLLYASDASGPSGAFGKLSVRKIDAGVTNVINARFNRHKPAEPT